MPDRDLFEDPSTTTPTEVVTIVPTAHRAPDTEAEMRSALVPGLRSGMAPAEVERVVLAVQSQVAAIKRVKAAMIGLTSPAQWVAQKTADGTDLPYLEENGAVRLVHCLGVEMVIDKVERIDYEDGTYRYVYHGRARSSVLGTQWFPVIGGRWSGDGFFTKLKGGASEADRRAAQSAIDPGDIQKAALTNFRGACVKVACGLDGCTWEELAEAGIDRTKVKGVDYKAPAGAAAKNDSKAEELTASSGDFAGEKKGDEMLVKCSAVTSKSGASDKGPWTKYTGTLSLPDGSTCYAATFHESVAAVFKAAAEKQVSVRVWLEKKGNFWNANGAELVA